MDWATARLHNFFFFFFWTEFGFKHRIRFTFEDQVRVQTKSDMENFLSMCFLCAIFLSNILTLYATCLDLICTRWTNTLHEITFPPPTLNISIFPYHLCNHLFHASLNGFGLAQFLTKMYNSDLSN